MQAKKIWRFEIRNGKSAVEMPKGSEILTVQAQGERPSIWALVSPNNEMETRHFELFGTGEDIHCEAGVKREYINTFQLHGGNLVFHLFERIF